MTARHFAWPVVGFLLLIGSISTSPAQDIFASYEQDRQISGGGQYAVGGHVCSPCGGSSCGSTHVAFDGLSECLIETEPNGSAPFVLEHVWVFQNVPAGSLCLTFNGTTTDENFTFLYRLFNVGQEGDAFPYSPVGNNTSSPLIDLDSSGETKTCALTTTSAAKDVHVVLMDLARGPCPGAQCDQFATQVNLDLLKITVGSCSHCP